MERLLNALMTSLGSLTIENRILVVESCRFYLTRVLDSLRSELEALEVDSAALKCSSKIAFIENEARKLGAIVQGIILFHAGKKVNLEWGRQQPQPLSGLPPGS